MARYLGVEVSTSKDYYFISYNSNDTTAVSEYVKLMTDWKLPIWYDYGLTVGAKWEAELAERIRGCKAVVMFISKNVFKKEDSYVVTEYKLAIKFFKKPVYIVLLDEIDNSDVPIQYATWWLELNDLQCIQAFASSSSETCAKDIMLALGVEPVLPQTPKKQPIATLIDEDENLFEEFKPVKKTIKVEEGKGIPIELLNFLPLKNSGIERISSVIERAYAQMGNIKLKVGEVQQGPRFTKFFLEFDRSVATRKVLNFTGELKVATGFEGVRINNEGAKVYVELPTPKRSIVPLAEVVDSQAFEIKDRNKLLIPIGENIDGQLETFDLCQMPHLLIAGSTGSGKSVFLSSFLVSFMMKYTPQEVKFVLIDPKRVEYTSFKDSPFLLFNQIIDEVKMGNATLKWLVNEMEKRYSIFSQNSVRNINDYNKLCEENNGEKMPKIVVVADEIADFMLIDKKGFETSVVKLAQKSRACGIHLVLATQRPSIDVLTGTIKANFSSRIALKVVSFIDSRTILDRGGAENLNRWGDILCITPQTYMSANRYQSAYVSQDEINAVIEYTSEYYGKNNDNGIIEEIKTLID